MNLSSEKSFITRQSDKLWETLGEEDAETFASLATEEARVRFVYGLSPEFPQEAWDDGRKNVERALDLKKSGNECFKNFEYMEAFRCYSESLIQMPSERSEDIAILFANRAAALHKMVKYKLCLQDIARAVAAKYPQHLMYKVLQRQAKCHLALKQYDEALESFKALVYSLVWAKMADGKLARLELYADDMIDYLVDRQRTHSKRRNNVTELPVQFKPFLNSALEYQFSEQAGRFAVAMAEIKVAEPIVIETPHASVLLEEFSRTHCHHCLNRLVLCVPCDACTNAVFCSETCKLQAQGYHKFECEHLSSVWRSGLSATHQLGLRIMTQRSLGYFLTLKDELDKGVAPEEWKSCPSGDYRKIHSLLTHTDQRDRENIWQRSVAAVFLLNILEKSKFFVDDETDESKMYIGGLILHNLLCLEMNDHEIGEYQQDVDGIHGKSVVIGDGIYTSVVLFNHSCEPNIIRYYRGNAVYMHAISSIKPGDIISENYGPMYTHMKRDVRRRILRDQYKFDCLCRACLEDWPLNTNLDTSVVQLKCADCSNAESVAVDMKAYKIKCSRCGGSINWIKYIEAMKDAEQMYQMAANLHDSGKAREALAFYVKVMNTLEERFVPPSWVYNACQQRIRRYFLELSGWTQEPKL